MLKKSPCIAVSISHVTDLREEQYSKHPSPKFVTDDGIVIEDILLQL